MSLKKILNFLFVITMLFSVSYASDFFQPYGMTFLNEKSDSAKVLTYECLNSDCSEAVPADIELYKGDASQCWQDFGESGQTQQYLSCLENYKLTNDVVDLNSCDVISDDCSGDPYVWAKYDTSSSFGYVSYFFTNGDDYIPEYARLESFNCNFDVCTNTNPAEISFTKVETAQAEVGQLNIVNLEDSSKPVQVEVPVEIEDTVCSAFTSATGNMFRPNAPEGYSDFSADTRVSMNITNSNTGEQYLSESTLVQLETDVCAGLAMFSWTPDSTFEDEEVKFKVETEVTDNQVLNTLTDWAEVTETVYPTNLDGTCWTRTFDFTLSNTPEFELTSSIAQIKNGETLYAGFKGGAYRDESITPMSFDAQFYFNNTLVHETTLESLSEPQEYFVSLSSNITGLEAGSYNVTLLTIPNGVCDTSSSVKQTQNLELLAPETYEVNFNVRDSSGNDVENASITLELIDADDNFQVDPLYNHTLITNVTGIASFEGLYAGDYTYTLTHNDYESVTNEIHIGSNSQIGVTLDVENSAPVIDLPQEISEYYTSPVVINVKDYIYDFNNDFNELNISATITSDNGYVTYDNNRLYITTDAAGDVIVEVSVEDPAGASATDSMVVHFTDNHAPSIEQFIAEPDNIEAGSRTNFYIAVEDEDNDALTCSIDFGDGEQTVDSCSNLNGVAHQYNQVKTYNAQLTVSDGTVNETMTEQIFTFEREYAAPVIEYLTIESSNGVYLPTNLTLNWEVTHPDNLSMNCSLIAAGVSNPVSCDAGVSTIENFDTEGNVRFSLIVYDGEHQVSRTVDRTFIAENHFPEIENFSANPTFGIDTLTTTFTIETSDADNENLTCTLRFADGTSTNGACEDLNGIEHTYSSPGNYNTILEVTDGIDITYGFEYVEVVSAADVMPTIEYFTLNTQTGDYTLPNTLIFDWSVIHPLGADMQCSLVTPLNTTEVNCTGTYNIENYNISGTSDFTLVASDSQRSINQTISQLFVSSDTENNTVDLTLDLVDLRIAEKITPGAFEFGVSIENETLNERELYFRPIISCDGVSATLDNSDEFLDNSAISKNSRNEHFVYIIDVNTNDFKTNIPVDRNCRFTINVVDRFGTDIRVTDLVTFTYPQEEKKIKSISGRNTDVLKYMSTAISEEINTGYNSIEFNLVNNEEEVKDMTITMISPQLDLDHKLNVNIGPLQQRSVSIPLYIQEDTETGLYPVRISVAGIDDKVTKYSYININ